MPETKVKKQRPLYVKILIGLIAGFLFGLGASFLNISSFVIDWIAPFGDIFIRLLTTIAIPLVLFSIISGIAGLSDSVKIGKIALKTVSAYLVTTIVAITLGLGLVNLLQPGANVNEDLRIHNRFGFEKWLKENGKESPDGKFISNSSEYQSRYDAFIKSNSLTLAADEKTNAKLEDIKAKAKSQKIEKDKGGPLKPLVDIFPKNIFQSLSNNKMMLQIITFAVIFGIALSSIKSKVVQPVKDLVEGLNTIFLKMIDMVMNASPYFIFALLAGSIAKTSSGNLASLLLGVGYYSIIVIIGLGILAFVFYPLLVSFLGKTSFKKFLSAIKDAQLVAFSTSSSAATLPKTIDCVEHKIGVNKSISNFVLPIGATVNMDGTSLYQAIAVIFLAQFHMIDLSFEQQLTIVLTTTLASIGSAAVPSAGLVMLMMVLESVGLNPAWIAIIFPVDRILDMCRTVINVTGDAAVTTIIAHSENQIDKTEN